MSGIAIILIGVGAVVGVALIARLFWPRAHFQAGPDNNWEQGLNNEFPSMKGGTSVPADNVQSGYNIAFGAGDRD